MLADECPLLVKPDLPHKPVETLLADIEEMLADGCPLRAEPDFPHKSEPSPQNYFIIEEGVE